MLIRLFALCVILILGCLCASAQESQSSAITVYNDGTALIRDSRSLSLEQGLNTIKLSDIASSIDPSSVSARAPGIQVIEQSYQASLASRDALFAHFRGQEITATAADGTVYTGEVILGRGDDLILRLADGDIVMPNINDGRDIQFPYFPDELAGQPTLQWLLNSDAAGEHEVEITYLAGGLNWSADYNLLLNEDEDALDLVGWITLSNRSGKAFSEAQLKLVAGDVQRVQAQPLFAEARASAYDMGLGGGEEAVEQREIFEYQLYEVARPVSIKHGETKQIEFVSGKEIAAETVFVFDGSPRTDGYYSAIDYPEGWGSGGGDVLTYLAFSTDDEDGLGADLPAGRARVYLHDLDGAGLLIGENRISHTSQGEDVSIRLGAAFDLAGERSQTSYQAISRTVAREAFEIRLRSHKDDETVEIRVPERLYRWSDWQIIESSAPYEKLDAATIEFYVEVPPGGEASVTYTVEYTFPRIR